MSHTIFYNWHINSIAPPTITNKTKQNNNQKAKVSKPTQKQQKQM